MQPRKISIAKALAFGFNATAEHIRLFTLSLLTAGCIMAAIGLIGFFLFRTNVLLIGPSTLALGSKVLTACIGPACIMNPHPITFYSAVFFIVALSIIQLLYMGLTAIALNIYDNKTICLHTLFSQYDKVFQALIAILLYAIVVAISVLCFIIPGIILFIRLSFFGFFIIDKNVSSVESLEMSYYATADYFWEIFAAEILIFSIAYLGVLTLIGFIITLPLTILIATYIYRQVVPVETCKANCIK